MARTVRPGSNRSSRASNRPLISSSKTRGYLRRPSRRSADRVRARRRRGQLAAVVPVASSAALRAPRQRHSMRLSLNLHLAPDARTRPQLLLMTLGGADLLPAAQLLRRSRAQRRRIARMHRLRAESRPGDLVAAESGSRIGATAGNLAAVAQVPGRLRAAGVKIAKLALVGVVFRLLSPLARRPRQQHGDHANALVVVDSYLDLPSRHLALPGRDETRTEIDVALGGTLEQVPTVYAAHSPSHHLDGLSRAIAHGLRLVVVWSVSSAEQREFHGATCSRLADAEWLARLSNVVGKPVTGYVTKLPHAHALWDRGQALLELAGLWHGGKPLLARRVVFRPGHAPPRWSYC